MRELRNFLQRRPAATALALTVAFATANLVVLPTASPTYWTGLIGTLLPLALVAIASTFSVLGGGIDLSIGPQAVFGGILIVAVLIPAGITDPWAMIPIVLGVGALLGAVNGLLVAVLQFPAIIATLCTMFILIGVNMRLAPQPVTGSAPWIDFLASRWLGVPAAVIVLATPFAIWGCLLLTSYVRNLRAAGSDPVAAFSAGVPVTATLFVSYVIGGVVAALAGVALTSLIKSSDASQSTTLILVALAAVALGGTSFAGGHGGPLGSLFGATTVFLLQNLLTAVAVPSLWVGVSYGVLLVGAVILSSVVRPVSLIGRLA